MLHKGHTPSPGTVLVAVAIILACSPVVTWGVDRAPLGGAATITYGPVGEITARRFIGRELPPLPRTVQTHQAGPDPDSNLTRNAWGTEEYQPNAAPSATMNRVAFSSDGEPLNGLGPIGPPDPEDPNFNIWIMRPDGSEQVRVVNLPGDQFEPAYDPGGRLIAFAGNQTGRWEIYTVEVASGVVRCLTDRHPGDKRHPTWNPDGTWVAYAGNAEGNWDIYKMPAAADQPPTRLTTSPSDDTDPAWVPVGNPVSPGGHAIAYTATVGAVTRINWVHAETLEIDALSDGGGDGLASDREPAWSRDGMQLAFASNRLRDGDTPANRSYNIWRMSAIGEVVGPPVTEDQLVSNRDLTNINHDRNPSWSAPADRQPLRIFYESERPTPEASQPDIWATQFRDTTPPVLTDLPWTTVAGQGTARKRQFAPGDMVYIHAPMYDADSGVSRVFARLKNPDNKVWSMGFWGAPYQWDSGFDGVQYLEWDYQTVATIELFDDGEPEDGDALARDGVFSGAWDIPLTLSIDVVIDIFAIDESGNSQNYDSVYGFTSRAFSPSGNVLFVNDYCEGQHFLYELGYNNDYSSAWYTESFYTFNPGYSPNAANQMPGESYHESKDTIKTYAWAWGVDERYETWRVICRGAVPASVYQYYLPTVEYQLDPVEASEPETGHRAEPTRAVPVAERAVIWAAPHTGNRWIADGSIVDAGTQADLAFFLRRGGRLFISGSDLAWALTMNGTVPNDFLTSSLRATFVRDTYIGNYWYYIGYGPNWNRTQRVDWDWSVVGSGSDPVAFDPWVGTGSPFSHYHVLARPSAYDSTDMPTTLDTPDNRNNNATHQDAHPYSWRPDVIEAAGDATVLYRYGSATGPTAGLRHIGNPGSATESRLVFLAFGFESIHRGYHSPGTPIPPHCKNHRAHLVHNTLCWMRTGAFQGKVLDVAGGKPVRDPNPIVLMWRGLHTAGDRSTPPDYAVRCQDDGSYMISGIPPAFYSMEAVRPGYEIDHYDGYVVHGGWEPFVVDFTISRARPGVAAGTVTSEATAELLPLVVVTAYPVPEPPEDENGNGNGNGGVGTGQVPGEEPDWDELEAVGSGTTGVQGTYKIENLAPGTYYIRAQGDAIGYGSQWFTITIVAGGTTTQDFQLPAADGTLIATVLDGDTQAPVDNALVEIRTDQGLPAGQGTTGADGIARVNLQPGTFTGLASAAGYRQSAERQVTVVSNETASATLFLFRQPPGRITGSITSATSGQAVGGITVRLLSNEVPIMSTVTRETFTTPADGSPRYNYDFDDVPTGRIAVRPEPVGFTANPTQRVVTVETGVTTPNVSFTLTSLWTFPGGLQLVSMPYDYSFPDIEPGIGSDRNEPATLLGIPAANLKMATWEASVQRYRIYPQAPSDRFRLGVGYWVRLPGPTDVTRQGATGPDPAPIPMEAGWNLIGAPHPQLIDFYTARVVDRTGLSRSMQEALAQGLIEGGMFAYLLGGYQNTSVFNPWVGTWLKASRPLTLWVSREGALATPAQARPAVLPPDGGWLARLETSVDGLVDTATHFGAAPAATAGYDPGLDMAKPPAPDLAPYVYAAFVNDDWGERSGHYAMDVRPAHEGRQEKWRLRVWTNVEGGDVTVRWPDLSAAPASVRPVLRDVATGRTTYMRTGASYTFQAGEQPRDFEIELAAPGAGLALSAVAAREAGAGRCQITYTLSAAAEVAVEIINVAGRPIRQVSPGRVDPAGTHSLVWDGRSAAGTRAPSGRYLVRVTARGADGQQTHQVVPLQVRR